MRLIGLFSIATLIALVLQTTLPRLLPLGLFVPDLVLILAVDLGLRHHGSLSAAMAFAMGYATDAFSGSQLGLNALTLTLVFLLAYWLARSLISTSVVIGVVAVFAGVMFKDIGGYFVSSGWSTPPDLHTLIPPMLLQATITALLAPWVFGVMDRAARIIGLRQRAARE